MPNPTGEDESEKSALDTANVRKNATAVRKRAAPATPSTSASNAKKQKPSGRKTPTKKQQKRSPSSAGINAGTPSSVASGIQFFTPEKQKELKEVKMQEQKLTEVEEIETKALAIINSNTKSTRLDVHRSMWAFAAECECRGDEEEIFFQRCQVNHNCVAPPIANEITNNFLGNPINADQTGKVYECSMGGDMHCLFTCNDEVNVCSEIFYIL